MAPPEVITVPGGSRSNADAALAGLIAAGFTTEAAAARAGVSSRTAFRRAHDPAFRALVREQRMAMMSRAAGVLADGAFAASLTLRGLLDSASEPTRLRAAQALLTLGRDFAEHVDLADLLQQVEGALAAAEPAA